MKISTVAALLTLLVTTPTVAQVTRDQDLPEETNPPDTAYLVITLADFSASKRVTLANFLAGTLDVGDFDTRAELDALLTDATLVYLEDIDTVAELDALLTDGDVGKVGAVAGVSPNVPGGGIDLVAGANVTVTADDAGDSITISATGGGGGGGAVGPGTPGTYAVWTGTDTVGDGRITDSGADVLVAPGAGGRLRVDGDFQLYRSGGNSFLSSASGKLGIFVAGAPVLDFLFAGPTSLKRHTMAAGVTVSAGGVDIEGGFLGLGKASGDLPACTDDTLLVVDQTGDLCWCDGSGWQVVRGAGVCL